MPEMIERVARVLEKQAWAALAAGDTLAYRNRRTSSLRKARAAFKELREPTEAMCAAAEEEGTVVGCCNITAEPAAEIWQSMIDAALA